MNKQAIVDVLNSLPIIDKQGGEDGYMIIANNDENRQKLNDVGVTDGIIESYSEGDTTCILSMAVGQKYADDYVGGKFIIWGELDDEIRDRILHGNGTAADAYRLLQMIEPELFE